MEETAQNNQNPSIKQTTAKNPAIRTMRSDMDKLFKESRPSLAQMMKDHKTSLPTVDSVAVAPATHSSKSPLMLLVILVIAAIAVFGYFYFFPLSLVTAPPPPPQAPETPAALFYTERTRTISGDQNNPVLLLRQIEDITQTQESEGTFVYIPIKLLGTEGGRYATAEDFFKLYGAKPPANFLISIENVVMPFVYHSSEGARFGFALKSRDTERTLQGMLAWEASLLRDTAPLFFKEPIEATVAPFESRTFRNIDWKFLDLSGDKDLGVAYSLFPSKKFLVITTSQDAVETIINRFYEGI